MNPTRVTRGALILLGGVLLARGAWLGYTSVGSSDRIHVLVWLVLGIAIHDGLLAPTSVLLGRFALPHFAVAARWGARALLAWVGAVLIIGLPLVHQAPRRANPTVEVGRPFVGVCVAIALGVVLVVAAQVVVTAVRSSATKRPIVEEAGASGADRGRR